MHPNRRWPACPAPSDLALDEQVLKDNKIAADGPGLLEFFRGRTVAGNEDTRIKTLIRQLGDDDFETREKASAPLVGIGTRARPLLEKAAMDPDVEIVRRAQDCLKQIDQGTTTSVLATAVRVLARKHPAKTIETLLNYLPSAEDQSVAEEIRLALVPLAVKDGKSDAALVAALTDKNAAKRGGAGSVLARAARPTSATPSASCSPIRSRPCASGSPWRSSPPRTRPDCRC